MIRALALALALVLVGCASKQVQPGPEPVRVYTRAQIDDDLRDPCAVQEPAPGCTREGAPVLCNGQLARLLVLYRAALAACDADKTAILSSNAE